MENENFLQRFLRLESASGVLLFIASAFALVFCNTPLQHFYQNFFNTPLPIHLLGINIDQSFLFWLNEGLMTLFFFLIGLELKREIFSGELSKPSQIILPSVAALGGMVIPAMIFLFFNITSLQTQKGWAIPVATDIAFALGVLSLFGKKVPVGLKIFLMALAIFDDVGAIFIIAVFHTQQLTWPLLLIAGLLILVLFIFNRINVKSAIPYLLMGLLLWLCVLKSGVHATLAGVILGLMLPLDRFSNVEEKLHPWITFLILPLFAFGNAGVTLRGLSFAIFFQPVVLGVILGLLVGKQVGVMFFSWILIHFNLAKLPQHVSWLAFYGVAVICGVGFTMSLFLGTLAFQENTELLVEMRLGVLAGSFLSGLLGAIVLWVALNKRRKVSRA